MPKYDFRCEPCNLVDERVCMIAERESQTCNKCGGSVTQLFTPPTQIIASPQVFKHTFGELYGTSSEKDWLKEHPEAVRVNQSTFKTRREKDEARWAKAHKEAADIETALKANKTLRSDGRKKSRSAA